MRKRNLLKASSMLVTAALLFAACSKDNKISTDKNSTLKIENIAFQDLTGTGSLNITGYTKFIYTVAKADSSLPMDTVKLSDYFAIDHSGNHTQTYNFNTPERAKILDFSFNVVIANGKANGVTIDNLSYSYNGKSYISKSGNMTKVIDFINGIDTFKLAETVNF